MLSKTQRIVLSLALILTFALSVTAYAQDDATISPQACAEPGNLTMWVWDENWATTIQSSIDQWIAEYCPGATVDLQVQPWGDYWDQLQTNASGGDLPDVFNMSQDRFRFYAENDALLDLQPYWDAADVDTTTWGTGIVDPYRWGEDSDLFAGPVNWDTVAVLYNKDMFDAAGLDYPTADWTWDDFAADAEALTDADAGVYGAVPQLGYQTGYANFIASTGETPVVDAGRTDCTLDNPQSIEALNFLKDLYDRGIIPSVSEIGGASGTDAFNFWASGRAAMVTAGSWSLPSAFEEVPFNWDIVQLPRNPESERSRSILHSVGYVADARTENPDLAANLILFLVSDEGQQFFADAGGVAPANPAAALQSTWMDSFGDSGKNIQAFVDATEDSQGVTAFGEIWSAIDTEIVVNIFDLDMSVEDAVASACDFIGTQMPEAAS